jgi:AcrR family transcriptional regulator
MRKGEQTRNEILTQAVALASEIGLEGLAIGPLASRLKMSKSGLFAHFGSKEELQLATLRRAQARFEETVFHPALAAPRGLPRLRALLERWLAWADDPGLPGGCVILGATAEYDDRPGPIRDALADGQCRLREAIARAVEIAVAEGHLAAGTDPEQLAFEFFAIVIAAHHDRRLLRERAAPQRALVAFERLVAQHAARPSAGGAPGAAGPAATRNLQANLFTEEGDS